MLDGWYFLNETLLLQTDEIEWGAISLFYLSFDYSYLTEYKVTLLQIYSLRKINIEVLAA